MNAANTAGPATGRPALNAKQGTHPTAAPSTGGLRTERHAPSARATASLQSRKKQYTEPTMKLKTRLILSITGDAILTLASSTAFAFVDHVLARGLVAVVFLTSAASLFFGVRFLNSLPTEE